MRRQAALRGGVGAVATGILLAAAGCEAGSTGSSHAPSPETAIFLARYWPTVPAARVDAAVPLSLEPADCGTCHKAQFDDWRTSLHSRAMGPGVNGQLLGMEAADRQDCQRCHAPLREQLERDSPLAGHGLFCAACHIREGRTYGPPRRDGSRPGVLQEMPHGGWTPAAAFEDSEFCVRCHQFSQDGYALNGKPLENTFAEWKASRHSAEGRSCQSCHMPGRRHLWRGIHDPAMTRTAFEIETMPVRMEGGVLQGGWRIRNSGAGHFFPTYVTPRVVATLRQETADGRGLDGTAMEYVIAREISADLTRELSDTRVAPDEVRELRYSRPVSRGATRLALSIRVEPDAFYSRMYGSLLQAGLPASQHALIEQALVQSIRSQYVVFAERAPINGEGISEPGASRDSSRVKSRLSRRAAAR